MPATRCTWLGCFAWVRSSRSGARREVEAARDLVRAREDAHADLMRARHRSSNCFCARPGLFRRQAWTRLARDLAASAALRGNHTAAAFDHHFDAVLSATAADRLDEQIIAVAAAPLGRSGRPAGLPARHLRADRVGA